MSDRREPTAVNVQKDIQLSHRRGGAGQLQERIDRLEEERNAKPTRPEQR